MRHARALALSMGASLVLLSLLLPLGPAGDYTPHLSVGYRVAHADAPWGANVRVNDDTGTAEQRLPAIAVDDAGNAYAVWRDGRSANWDVYFSRRDAATGIWDANIKVNDTGTSDRWNPAIAVDGSGNAYVVWADKGGTLSTPTPAPSPPPGGGGGDNPGIYFIYFSRRDASSGTWSASVRVNDTSGAATPAIAVDSAGNAYAVWEAGNIYFSRRDAATGAWSAQVRVNDDTGTAQQASPAIAVDALGNAYAAWTDYRNGDEDIYFSRRDADTGDWGANVRVNDAVWASQFGPDIAVDSSGNAYAVWSDCYNAYIVCYCYFSRRDAATGAWGANVRVSDSGSAQRGPDIAVDAFGNAYAVWHALSLGDRGGSDYDVYFSRRDAASGAWSANVKVSDDTGTAQQASPAIAVDALGNAYAVWEDYRNGNWDIYSAFGQLADTVAPTGTVAIAGGAAYVNSITITATLTATDATSGVAQASFSNDGASWSEWYGYASTLSWSLASDADGSRTVWARFRDAAGNVSEAVSDTITLDATPPAAPSPDDGVSGPSNDATPTFSWQPVSDTLSGLAGYWWKVDSGSESFVSSTVVTVPEGNGDGSHTFYVRAADNAGNSSPWGSHDFSIDTVPPSAPEILQPPVTPTDSDRIVVSGFATPGLPVRLYVNGELAKEGSAGPTFGVWNFTNVSLTLGANVIVATSRDEAGNVSALSLPVVVDRVAVYQAPPAPMAEAVITATGGLVATANAITVTVPAGALAQETKVAVTPYAPVSAPGVVGILGAGVYASLTAVDTATGEKVTSFQAPVTITLSYDPASLGELAESSLAVSYYDEVLGRWVALPSVVDTVNHTVSAATTHFSVYSALDRTNLWRGDLAYKAYLPFVSSSASGW